MTLGELWVQLGVDMDGFRKALGQAKNDSTSFGSKVGGALKKGTSFAFKTIGAGIGIAAAAVGTIGGIALKKGFDRALDIEDAKATLKGLGYDAKAVGGITDSVLAAVKGTAYSLNEGMTIGASALASGVKEGKDLQRYITTIGDAAAIAKVPLGDMGAIFNKVQATGKVSGEVLNQMGQRGIPILQWLAKQYGVTAEEMTEMVSKGKVDAEGFRKAIEANVGGAALSMGETTRGAWANMMAAMGRLGAGFLESFFPQFRVGINGVTELLDAVAGPVKDLGVWLGNAIEPVLASIMAKMKAFVAAFKEGGLSDALKTLLPDDIVDTMGSIFNQLKTLWTSFMDALTGSSSGVKIDWMDILRSGLEWFDSNLPTMIEGATAVGTAIGSAFTWLVENGDTIATILKTIAVGFVAFKVIATIIAVVAPIVSAIGTVIAIVSQMAIAFGAVGGGVSAAMGVLAAAVGGPVTLIVAAIAAVIAIGYLLWSNWDTIKAGLIVVWDAIKVAAAATWEWLSGALSATWEAIKVAATAAWNGIKAFFAAIMPAVIGAIIGPVGLLVIALVKNWDKVKAGAQAAWNGIKAAISAVWNGVVWVFQNMTLPGILISKWSSIKAAASNAWNAVKTSITGVWSSITGAVGNVVSTVTSKFTGLLSSATNWGRNMLQNFISGVRAKIGDLTSVLSNAAGKVKDFLGFSSPTKEGPGSTAHKWAPNFMQMFTKGITDNLPQLQATMNDMAMNLQPKVAAPGALAVAGGSGTTWTGNIIVDGAKSPRETADEIMRELRRRGVKF